MRGQGLLIIIVVAGLMIGCKGGEDVPAPQTGKQSAAPFPQDVTAAGEVEEPPPVSPEERPPQDVRAVEVQKTVVDVVDVVAEVKPAPVRSRRPTPPKVGHLLTVADLVGVTGMKGWVSEGPIPGVSPEGDYNSILYTRPGSTHMVGVRLWELRQHRDAVARWNELLATHPNAEANEAVVADTFFWTRGSIAGLVFLEADRSRVVGISCHTELCNDTQLLRLATIAHGRAR